MRLFLAIDLPDKVKKSLSGQLFDLKKKYPDFFWVDENNYHITLLFLGEMTNVKKIKDKVKAAIYDKFHFYLYSYKMDLFMKSKITVYLGFRREKKIEELVKVVRETLGFYNEKKYIPHLTLARCRIPSKQQYFVLKKILSKQSLDIEFPVKKMCLYESISTGKEPIYKKISSFPLL